MTIEFLHPTGNGEHCRAATLASYLSQAVGKLASVAALEPKLRSVR